MPKGLVRFHHSGSFHFITFSCYHRLALLRYSRGYGIFEAELEAIRVRYEFVVAGYVLMPEHVHLLVSEPRRGTLATVIQVLKQNTSRKLKKFGQPQFWQRRYYDFVIPTEAKRVEKLRYMHRNPVKRGLVSETAGWRWSSFRHYATGEFGTVEIESEWTARRRELHRHSGEMAGFPPTSVGCPILRRLSCAKGGRREARAPEPAEQEL
jgi:putative transposase